MVVKLNSARKKKKMTYLTTPTVLGSAAIVSTIISVFNMAYASRPPHGHHHVLAPVTSLASYDDGYLRGLERLGIVKLPANLRRPLSSTVAPSGSPVTVANVIRLAEDPPERPPSKTMRARVHPSPHRDRDALRTQ